MTHLARSRPSAAGRAFAATAACLLALTLLGSSTGTAARWSDAVPLEAQAVSTGTLDLVLEPARTILQHTDVDPATGAVQRGTTALAGSADAAPALAPGDTVVVTTRARLDLAGSNLTATLTVDPGVPAGSPVVPRVDLAPAPGTAPLAPAPGPSAWTVTAAQDGAVYDVTVSYDVPADPSAQGTALAPGPLTVALTQN